MSSIIVSVSTMHRAPFLLSNHLYSVGRERSIEMRHRMRIFQEKFCFHEEFTTKSEDMICDRARILYLLIL